MKKIVIIYLFISFHAALSYAQKEYIGLSWGVYSGSQIFLPELTLQQNGNGQYTNTTGNIFFTYRHELNRRFQLGACVGIQTGDFIDNNYYNQTYSSFRLTIVTAACEFKFIYARAKYFEFYGFEGLGFSDYDWPGNFTKLSELRINSQHTPLGVSFGKVFRLYVEFGIGYKGIVNTGISYKFKVT